MHDAGEIKLSDASLNQFSDYLLSKINQELLAQHSQHRKIGRVSVDQLLALPCPVTIRKLVRTYRKSCGDLKSFLSVKPKRTAKLGLPKSSNDFLMERIKFHLSQVPDNFKHVARQVLGGLHRKNKSRRNEGKTELYVPSVRTIERRISNFDKFELSVLRDGYDRARQKHASISGGYRAQFIGERIEIDEWEVDLITWLTDLGIIDMLDKSVVEQIPRGRRWVCVAIDCATKAVLALRIANNGSADEIRQLISMISIDKTEFARSAGAVSNWDQHCGIQTLAADTGFAYANDITEWITDLGAIFAFAPATDRYGG